MKDSQILRKARDLIAERSMWMSGRTEAEQNDPCRECIYTAVTKFAPYFKMKKYFGMGYREIWRYNDTHTHKEVLVLFDKAIQAAEKAS